MQHGHMSPWLFRIVGLVRPCVNPCWRSDARSNRILSNDAPPKRSDRDTRLFDRNAFNVGRVHAMKFADYIPLLDMLPPTLATMASPCNTVTCRLGCSVLSAWCDHAYSLVAIGCPIKS